MTETNNKKTTIKIFENQNIRTVWDSEKEDYYFSVTDVVKVLTNSTNPRKYWSVLKTRLKKEGSELTTNCSQLKMQSKDGKFYKTDVLDTKGILRLIQSIPSPKAEPFKLWLAKVQNCFSTEKWEKSSDCANKHTRTSCQSSCPDSPVKHTKK